ncbi:MAG: tetratricopeptide repeat protein [Streptosporangiales bacterium]|nr:tetratricopeptide repeat protein [Streptosporangiales bacterium]
MAPGGTRTERAGVPHFGRRWGFRLGFCAVLPDHLGPWGCVWVGQHRDLSGGRPDPLATESVAEFAARLRLLKVWAGDPSFERLARSSGVPRSTLADALSVRGGRLPALEVVRGFVRACGVGEERAAAWEAAWRRLRAGLTDEPSAPASGAGAGRIRPATACEVPAQLPLDVPAFAGRGAESARLDAMLAEADERPTAVVISALLGTAGVGKTALALHWAHRVAERFGDGQLYVNLRGFDRAGSVMSPAEAVRGFLDAFGVPPQRIPAGLDAQVGLYRSLLAGRRVLVVLDNARDVEQVRPLLPGSPGCLVVVTSRNQLPGLVAAEAAHPITLDLLTPDEARDVLARRLGADRIAAEPQTVEEIIHQCARLPLALAIVAARAATHPGFPLEALAGQLREARGGLDAFADQDADTDVRAVLSWSYNALDTEAARLFRLLGMHPGPDVAAPAAAGLAGIPASRVRPLLAELTRAHLVAEHTPGRYTFHDLLRAYATELARTLDTQTERRAVQRRVLDHYLHTACAADRLLYPFRDPIMPVQAGPDMTSEDLADHRQAMAWFTAEHPVLLAAIRQAAGNGFDTHIWQLAWTLTTFFVRQGHWHQLVAAQRAALAAARRLTDREGQAHAHRDLARAYALLDRFEDAHPHYRQALDLFGELGDHAGQVRTHLGLGVVFDRQDRHDQALRHAQQALHLSQAAGHRAGEATALNALGWYHVRLGDCQKALTRCQRALILHQNAGHRAGEANTWDSHGYAHHRLGHHRDAVAYYRRALDLFQDLGGRYNEADTLTRLGDAHYSGGDSDAARDAWRHALAILDEFGHPDADRIRAKLNGRFVS